MNQQTTCADTCTPTTAQRAAAHASYRASTAAQAAAKKANAAHSDAPAARHNGLMACTVRVAGHTYTQHWPWQTSWETLFTSTCAAVVDALDRFPAATKVSARPATP